MSVIIRLQNLPWSANALDIRQYFQGLSIPEGGVHIVGGEQGDAFIAFSTDEDARQAMMADGGKIKEVKLKLLLSSRAEMQKVIETARQQTLALQNFMQIPAQQATPPLPPAPVAAAVPHMMGVPAAAAAVAASGVLSHLHMQHSGGHPPHMLAAGNVPHHQQSLPPAQQSQAIPPLPPLPPTQQTAAPSSTSMTEKKDGERTRGDRRRSRSRSRDNSRRRSKDKDRDRYRRRSNRSRSRSRDRRRKDRSRDRSRSRDRTRDRRGRTDKDNGKDSKDKDKQNGSSDVVVVGQFPPRSNSKSSPTAPNRGSEGRRPPQQNLPPQPAMINGNMAKSAAPGGGWNNPQSSADIVPPPERPGGNNVLLPNPNAMTAPAMRMPGNFPPSSDMRGFPFPGGQDQQGWMPPRQPGIPPQQQAPPRFEDGPPQGRGGFRGGPPGRPPRSTRFEPTDGHDGPPEYDDVRGGPFPPPARGRERPVYDDDFRGGPRPPPPFRDGARGPRTVPHTCVEVRNVPVSAAYRDIREFFQSMHVLNIKLLNDEEGRKTGVAYVKFVSLENKEVALTMNGMTLHGSAVEILHVDDNIYEEALDCHQPNSDAVIVALHGLPHYANEQDIRRLFPGARLLSIVMSRSNNPHSPQAFIQFSTLQEGRRALGASGKLTVDGKEIFVERSNMETLMNTKKMVAEMGAEPHAEGPKSEEIKLIPKRQEPVKQAPTDCVLLQGLPPSSNDREILDFFSDVGLVPLRIHVMLDSNNTPSGDAFCEFSSCAEGARALAKNGNILGTKEVSVRSVVRSEMEQALGILEQKHSDEQPLPPRPMPGGRNGPMPPEHMRGGHMGGPMRGHGHMHPGEFMGRGGRFFGEMRGGPHMRGHRGMHHGPPHGGPPMMGRGHGHGHPPLPPPPPAHVPPHPDGPTVDKFGNPGCVIELQNVPYKADIDEIIEYFEGFDVARANVIRRYSDGGMPTGDARVALRAPAEAQRALQTLKFKKMRDRPIYLSIV
ncbi:hypothetical protein B566_EDAN006496 [Ephemera danica]|nr:hypothetical protein B566_EDAN006496 [Ephemera danica]